jgi:pyruvate decarboxylase
MKIRIGTMVTANVKPVILLLNNAGYTIERVIHGARQPYNNIPKANYAQMLSFFYHPSPESSYHKVIAKDGWASVFEDKKFAAPETLQVIEIVLDPFDVPWRLTKQIAMRGGRYLEELKKEGFIGEGRVGVGG